MLFKKCILGRMFVGNLKGLKIRAGVLVGLCVRGFSIIFLILDLDFIVELNCLVLDLRVLFFGGD